MSTMTPGGGGFGGAGASSGWGNRPSGAQIVRWYQHTGDPDLFKLLQAEGIPVSPPPPNAKPGALREFIRAKLEQGQSPLAVSTPDGRPAPETVAEIDGQPVEGAVQMQEAGARGASSMGGGEQEPLRTSTSVDVNAQIPPTQLTGSDQPVSASADEIANRLEGRPRFSETIDVEGKAPPAPEIKDPGYATSITDLGEILERAEQGDEEAKQALTSIAEGADKEIAGSEKAGEDAGTEMTPQWKREGKRALGQVAGGLVGSGIAALFGGKKAAGDFMQGYAPRAVEQFKLAQAQDLKRRQDMWETTYKDMMELPAEIYGEETFGPLTQAAEALRKDMADGSIDNEKNVSNYLTMKAKYAKELAEFQKQVDLRNEAEKLRNEWDTKSQYVQERRIRAQEIVGAPPGKYSEAEVNAARAELAELDKTERDYEQRQRYYDWQIERAGKEDEYRERADARAERASERADESIGLQRRRTEAMEGRRTTQASSAEILNRIDLGANLASAEAGRTKDPDTDLITDVLPRERARVDYLVNNPREFVEAALAAGAQWVPGPDDPNRKLMLRGRELNPADGGASAQAVMARLEASARYGMTDMGE